MYGRRQFLKSFSSATAGIFFGGCGLIPSAIGSMQSEVQRKRREVTVGGLRVKTVDVHAHVTIPDIWDLIKDRPEARENPSPLNSPSDPRKVDARLADMDTMGIDVQAVSSNTGLYWAEPDLARQLIRIQNENIAELCTKRPDRFVGMGCLALQHPDLAVEQLTDGVKKLGMRGFIIGGSVNGQELSDPKFLPIWAKAEELGTLIFIHPRGFSGVGDRTKPQARLGGNGHLTNVVGNPLETTLALSHLIQEGVLDRYPGLKICAAHAGGFLPSYASRSDQCLNTFLDECQPLKKKPSEYLKQLYYDSIIFSNEGMRHLIAEVGASQIVLGTDYPTLWNRTAVDRILAVSDLSDAERIAMLGGTVSKLLRINS